MTANRNHGFTVVQGGVDDSIEWHRTELLDRYRQETERHLIVAQSVDRVLQLWLNVGLATLWAEVRGVRTGEIMAILDDLAAASERARVGLLSTEIDHI